jgi:hypothetical protein
MPAFASDDWTVLSVRRVETTATPRSGAARGSWVRHTFTNALDNHGIAPSVRATASSSASIAAAGSEAGAFCFGKASWVCSR